MKCQRERNRQQIASLQAWVVGSLVLTAVVLLSVPAVQAATSFDGGGLDQWWFNPENWSAGPTYLPPGQIDEDVETMPLIPTDAQVNDGLFLGAEGVVFDPENDPYYDDALLLTYPTGSQLVGDTSLPVEQRREFGPQTLYRLYVSRHTTNTNLLTIKSGDIIFAGSDNPDNSGGSSVIIGRSGSTGGQNNLGKVVQEGGAVRLPYVDLDIGHSEFDQDTGSVREPGNGVYEYKAGTLDVGYANDNQIRISQGTTTDGIGAGGIGRLIVHNPTSGGHIRAFDVNVAAYAGSFAGFQPGLDPDGVTTGIGIVEFHYANGSTRVVQTERNAILNNGVNPDTAGIRSARLVLTLDEAPITVDGVPNDLPLFDTDFGNLFAGGVAGIGDKGQIFSNEDGTVDYMDGDTVSAFFAGTRYDWTISYDGEITYANATDADNSVVATITENSGSAAIEDIVLIGLGSEFVGLAGDYNEDDVVNAADYTVWRNAVQAGATSLPNEGPGISPGAVDQDDYLFWRTQYGNTLGSGAGGGSASVPEPSALLLALIAGLGTIAIRRRR